MSEAEGTEAEVAGSRGEDAAVVAEREHRLAKLDAMRERGIDPYPPRFDREQMLSEVRERFGSIAAGERTGEKVVVAGRVMLLRRQGGIDFAALRDRSDELQLVVERDVSGEEMIERFNDLDLGDWIGVHGEVMSTDHGELSIEVESFELLSKSLRALPKEEHGPTDVDVRYRERYLDLIVNSRAREIFAIRSRTISEVRRTLLDRNFTEVETPVLDVSAGGAAARPFITHHNALDIEMYLRIALELPLKRLIVGGMDRVFEIGRVFRNEGLDTRHNPEFTLLEAYQALGDYTEMLDLTEELVAGVCERTLGHTTVKVGDRDLSLAKPFRRATMIELVKEHAGVDMHPSMRIEEARSIAKDLGIEIEQDWGAGRILAEAYDAYCEDKLFEPTFVMDHPREVSPLARAHRDDPTLTERFELVIAGRELANAYSELNDPVDQRSRFEAEARAKAAGDEEAEDVDEDYIRALEFGLPPTGGLGVGIDRLVMLLAEANTIREVILFPTMRPEGGTHRPPAGAPIADPGSLPTPASLAPEPDTIDGEPDEGSVTQAVATPEHQPRFGPARILGWLTALIGLVSLLPTLPGVAGELGIDPFLNETGRVVTDVVSVLSGLVLIVVSRQLTRGRKGAWQIAVAMFALSGLAHLVRGPDPIAVALDAAMLLALLRWREEFRVPSDPRSLGSLARFLPAYLVLVLIFGFGTLFAERHHISPDLTVGNILHETFAGLVGLDGPLSFDRHGPDDFFHAAALALGIAGLLIVLFLLFRPLAARSGPSADDRAHARRLVRRWGSDSLAYFSLHEGKSYFFSSDGRAMVPYAYASGYALVSADPIGAPGSRERIIDEFLAYCRDRAWRVAFLAVREDHMPDYEARGFKGVYLGDEAIIRPDRFSLKGGTMKGVREAVNRVAREHSFRMIRETDAAPELIAHLNEISAEWRGDNEERGFTMELAREVDGTEPDFLLCLCLNEDERPVGFLRLVPCYGDDPGYSLDLMRRKPDAPNGLTEYLIANAALTLGERGFRRLSMNFAAWGRLFDTERPLGPMEKVQRSVASALNPYFQIESLRNFNQKFQPDWLPRSIAIEDTTQAPRVGLLYASVEGFLDVPVLDRFLAPSAAESVERGSDT